MQVNWCLKLSGEDKSPTVPESGFNQYCLQIVKCESKESIIYSQSPIFSTITVLNVDQRLELFAGWRVQSRERF